MSKTLKIYIFRHLSGTLPDIGVSSWLLKRRSATSSGVNMMFQPYYHSSISLKLKRDIWTFVRKAFWHWREVPEFWDEDQLPQIVTMWCPQQYHSFKKDWSSFLHPALTFQLVSVDIYKVWHLTSEARVTSSSAGARAWPELRNFEKWTTSSRLNNKWIY